MEIETEHLTNGFGESINWVSCCRTDHDIFGGQGPTRIAAEIDVLAKAAAEDDEARYELRELLAEADREEGP